MFCFVGFKSSIMKSFSKKYKGYHVTPFSPFLSVAFHLPALGNWEINFIIIPWFKGMFYVCRPQNYIYVSTYCLFIVIWNPFFFKVYAPCKSHILFLSKVDLQQLYFMIPSEILAAYYHSSLSLCIEKKYILASLSSPHQEIGERELSWGQISLILQLS